MAVSKFGMVYDKATGGLRKVIIPHSDERLDDPLHLGPGEAMHTEPIEMWHTGGPPHFLRDHIQRLHAAGKIAKE